MDPDISLSPPPPTNIFSYIIIVRMSLQRDQVVLDQSTPYAEQVLYDICFYFAEKNSMMKCVCSRRLYVRMIQGRMIHLFWVGPACDKCVWEVILLWCLEIVLMCEVLIFCKVFCDYSGVYCCEVDVFVFSLMVSGFVMKFVVYLVLLNVGCFWSLGVGLCSGCDGCGFFSGVWECVYVVGVMDVVCLVWFGMRVVWGVLEW